MRIISIFKDYYDVGLSVGHDKRIVYKRFQTEETYDKAEWKQKPVKFQDETSEDLSSLGMNYKWIVIGFCGKVFQCLQLEKTIHDPHHPHRSPQIKTICCYDAPSVRRAFQRYGTKKEIEMFLSKPQYRREGLRLSTLEKRFSSWNPDKYYDEFIRLRTPIFVVDQESRVGERYDDVHMRMRSNPKLEPYQFFQVFCPFTTFQEISMFIGGVIGMESAEVIEIADIYRRDAHGFDEWSFKTKPNLKPNRKRKGK